MAERPTPRVRGHLDGTGRGRRRRHRRPRTRYIDVHRVARFHDPAVAGTLAARHDASVGNLRPRDDRAEAVALIADLLVLRDLVALLVQRRHEVEGYLVACLLDRERRAYRRQTGQVAEARAQ